MSCSAASAMMSAQFVTNSATDGCSCDGSFVFTNPNVGLYTYTLFDSDGIQISQQTTAAGIFAVNALCPQVYVLQVDDIGATQTYVVNIHAGVTNIGNAVTSTICTTDGTTSLNSFLTNPMAGGIWTNPLNVAIAPNISPSTALPGLYEYTIQIGGCDVSTGVYLDVIQNANAGLSTTYDICDFYAPFQMIVFMAGSPDVNGVWFDINGIPMDGWFNPAAMDSASFVYMIDTVPNCAPVFSVMTVDENLTPDPGLDASVLVCANGTSFDMTDYLGGTPQLNGQWFDDSNNAVADIFNPLVMLPGVYRYKVDGESPCVDQNAFLTINFTADNPSGEDATYEVCETGGIINMVMALAGDPIPGGIWTNAQGVVVDNIFNPANEQAGIYTYFFPNVGCSPGDADLTIIIEQLPDAGLDYTAVVCETLNSYNLNSMLSQGADAGGIWTDENQNLIGANFIISGGGTNTFSYTVDGEVCPSNVAEFQLIVDPQASIPGNVQFAICSESAPISLDDLYTLSNLLYEDSQGQMVSNIFDPSLAQSMIITVINASSNSCPDGASVIDITVEQPAFQSASGSLDVCSSMLSYDLDASNALVNFALGEWTNELNNIVDNNVSLSLPGEQTFTFTSSNSVLCEASTWTFTLDVYEPLNAGSDTNYVFCTSDDEQALADLLPSSSIGNGNWNFQGVPFSSEWFDPESDPGGAYFYVIPANGPCPGDLAELDIIVQNGIDYSAGNDVEMCSGESPVIIGQDNPANCSFEWSPTQNLNNATVATPQVDIANMTTVPISYEYTVLVDDGVCSITDTVLVTLNPLPQIALNDVYEICNGETVTLNAGISADFEWSPSNFFPNQNTAVQLISPDANAEISVVAVNQWGCIGEDSTNIEVHPMPYAPVEVASIAACPPVMVSFSLANESTNCDNVLWSIPGLGNFEGDSIEVIAYESGIYNVTLSVTTDFGCAIVNPLGALIEVYDSPLALFEWEPLELTTIDPIAEFTDLSVDAISYEWDFAGIGSSTDPEPIFEFPNAQPDNFEVCLKVTNTVGCSDSTCNIIHLDNEYIFYAPNTFTPDDDGINDVFFPVIKGFDESTYHLQIFDRWGDLIFETKELEKPWTGNLNGGAYYAQTDVYVWQVTLKDKEMADYKVFKGHVTLLR